LWEKKRKIKQAFFLSDLAEADKLSNKKILIGVAIFFAGIVANLILPCNLQLSSYISHFL